MKITTGILGCALVAGLMTFASGKAQAKNLVISNEVYATFNLKISTEFLDGNKLKKASITSKQFLSDNNYDTSKVSLAVNTTTFDVWIVNKDSALTNLSLDDTLGVDFNYVVSSQKSQDKASFKDAGIFEVFSDSVDSFDISGAYSESYSWSKVDKNGEQNFKDSLKAKNLSGWVFVSDLDPENDLPATGSADYKGSGKILAE